MIFVTVGSYAPYDRLVEAVDRLALDVPDHEWFAQIGTSTYEPRNMAWERRLGKDEFDRCFAEADVIIGHAGMGTISGAMREEKPLVVVPRDPALGELVDNHQYETSVVFEAGGHVLVAWHIDDLYARLSEAFTFEPTPRSANPEDVASRIGTLLEEAAVAGRRRWFRRG